MPRVGFLPPSDPRIRGTIEAIERELLQDGLVLRYRTEEERVDGLPGPFPQAFSTSLWLTPRTVCARNLAVPASRMANEVSADTWTGLTELTE
jgi:GH15 family glucan-1,4-alpha-glucosidase